MKDPSGRYRHQLGRVGETRAVHYLESIGYVVLDRNYRSSGGEIDIVARDGDTFVFVEVKTGTTGTFGAPEERVDNRKQHQIGKVAMGYLQHHRLVDVDCRFDVIAVQRSEGEWSIRHFEDAFWLNYW